MAKIVAATVAGFLVAGCSALSASATIYQPRETLDCLSKKHLYVESDGGPSPKFKPQVAGFVWQLRVDFIFDARSASVELFFFRTPALAKAGKAKFIRYGASLADPTPIYSPQRFFVAQNVVGHWSTRPGMPRQKQIVLACLKASV